MTHPAIDGLYARHGEKAVDTAALQTLGYPAWMIHTLIETHKIEKTLNHR